MACAIDWRWAQVGSPARVADHGRRARAQQRFGDLPMPNVWELVGEHVLQAEQDRADLSVLLDRVGLHFVPYRG